MLCGTYCFVKVPAQYDGCTYQEVYNDLVLNHSCLPLGIYRAVFSLPQMFEYCSGGFWEINVHNDHSVWWRFRCHKKDMALMHKGNHMSIQILRATLCCGHSTNYLYYVQIMQNYDQTTVGTTSI